MIVLVDDPLSLFKLLIQDVAEQASLFGLVVERCAIQLLLDPPRRDRKRDDLRVRVIEVRAGSTTVILEYLDVPEARVPSQLRHPLDVHADDLIDLVRI